MFTITQFVCRLSRRDALNKEAFMFNGRLHFLTAFSLILLWSILTPTGGFSQEKLDIKGWELDSPYNKLYDLNEWDKWKGYMVKVKEVTPLPGMSPGIALIVKSRDDDEMVTVHLGPKSFIDSNSLGFRKGEKLTLKGAWAEIGDNEVFIASKVRKGDYYELKVRRTKDGTPYWTMTPEQLKNEEAGQ
jgi:hypothetical protein